MVLLTNGPQHSFPAPFPTQCWMGHQEPEWNGLISYTEQTGLSKETLSSKRNSSRAVCKWIIP